MMGRATLCSCSSVVGVGRWIQDKRHWRGISCRWVFPTYKTSQNNLVMKTSSVNCQLYLSVLPPLGIRVIYTLFVEGVTFSQEYSTLYGFTEGCVLYSQLKWQFLSHRMWPTKIAFWIISVIDILYFGLAISIIISNKEWYTISQIALKRSLMALFCAVNKVIWRHWWAPGPVKSGEGRGFVLTL